MSLPYQKDSCLKYAKENDFNIPEDYIFLEQFSWGYLDRPMLNHVLLLAAKWLIDFVVFTKRDRVARDQYVFQKKLKDLSDANVKIFYSEEKLTWDDAMDSFMGSTIIWFASWEREQIKLRTIAWKKQHAKENNKKKSPIFHWSATTVQRILSKASVYTWIYQSFSKQYKKIWAKTEYIWEKPKEDWISIEIPRIISDKQAELLLETLTNNRKYAKKRAVRSYMLQWKLFCNCEECLHNFTWYFHNPKQLRNYRCSLNNTWKVSEDRRCKNQISGLKIEWIVIDTLKELFTDNEYLLERALEESFGWNIWDKDRYHELYYKVLEINGKHKRNEELYIDWMISKDRFTELKKSLDNKNDDLHKEMWKELEIIKSEVLQEDAMKNIGDIINHLKESIELFFDNASYDELKELVWLVVEKIILPVDKKSPVRIILKIPAETISFSEKYFEEEMVVFTDEQWKDHNVASTWEFIPKELKLDKIKSPLENRTVEFSEDNWDNWESWLNTDKRFLKYIKNFYHQFYKLDQ